MPRLCLAALLLAAAAGAEAPPQRMLDDAEAKAFAAVGRLNVAGNRHCTATLIAADLVLTAAHCLYNPRTGRRAPPAELKFVAGQRRDAYAALRGVADAVTPPAYTFARQATRDRVATDLALLRLDAPIPAEAVAPIRPGGLPGAGPFAIIAYGRDRAYAASLREGCARRDPGIAVLALDCAVTQGVSGAPVLETGATGPEVVGVVAAMGTDGRGGEAALAAVLAPLLAELRPALSAPLRVLNRPESLPK